MFFISTGSSRQRKEMIAWLTAECPEYKFHDLDLTPENVISLNYLLKRKLPEEVRTSQPAEYVVNITGLENSLLVSEDGQIRPSDMTGQLNFERENLFLGPYITILWADKSFFITLQQEAPDFVNWVNHIFHFTDDREAEEETSREHFIPEPIQKKGFIPERSERLQQLEARFEELALNTEDHERLLKTKVDLLLAIANEYKEQPNYNKAREAYEKAAAIAKRTSYTELLGMIYFYLGEVYTRTRNFSEALDYYEQARKFVTEINYGNIYHQIGMVYQLQRKWTEALENYQLAIEWKEKTGNEYALGNTYHQIGIVYEKQRKWKEALKNYQVAIHWNEKTGNEYALGSPYHQIGRVYEEQRKWTEALANYQSAIEWKDKSGNEYKLGSTYHQIGKVYEEQGNLAVAKEWLEKSVENLKKFDHPGLPVAEESLARVEGKIGGDI